MKRWVTIAWLWALPLAMAMDAETRAVIEADWERQEKVSRNLTLDNPAALNGVLTRGRLMMVDLRELGAEAAADKAAGNLAAMEKRGDFRTRYLKARWILRELAFENPAIDFEQILFVKRQWPSHNHQCSHRVGEAQIPGANLCVLQGLTPDGAMQEILSGAYAQGGIGRPDLSYDARRVVFPFAKRRPRQTAYGYGKPGVRGGACLMYDVYEVDVDGSNLRQLTDRPDSEDTEPIYLPDGRIAFMSSRDNRLVQCGDWALACGMFSMQSDGTDVRRITEPKEGEFYPSMLEDGRILYTRWDYVMKAYNVIQQLWAVNPDGRGASLVFGDHFAYSKGPIAFFEARQIPGTSQLICIGAAHHNTGVGPVMTVDLKQHRGTRFAMQNLTPEVGYPEINHRMFTEVVQEELPGRGISNVQNPTGWYASPYPLTPNHFLVSASFEKNNAEPRGYAVYLMDVHHNRELIYRAKDASCYAPIPLRPRARPAALPDRVAGVPEDTPGTLIVSDIYRGLDGVPRGTVKYLRVLETHAKTVHTEPQRCDLGVNSGWDVRGVLGTVPVEPDGSAHFLVPPFTQLFLEALDKDFLEIRRMRNFMNVMPGEVNGCVGCHESYGDAPVSTRNLLAMQRPPDAIEPPPWGTGGVGFAGLVQPILNRHCTSCHDGASDKEHAFDLREGALVVAPSGYDLDAPAVLPQAQAQHMVSDAFLELLKYVSYIRVGGYQGEKLPLAPYATGSGKSRLMQVLKEGHYEVRLAQPEWRALAAWIDCNAPYYGSWEAIRIPGPGYLGARHRARVAARLKELGDGVAAYLDCGLQAESKGGIVSIKLAQGRPWTYTGTEAVAVSDGHRDIVFDQERVEFDVAGLEAGSAYTVNMTWWDFNTDQRRQSVWVAKPDGSDKKKIRATSGLPAFEVRKELPETVSLDLPPDRIKDGSLRISVPCEGGANAVVGEVWITLTNP